ncbi:MAG: hypothetical protein GY856_18460 [bacterium]|nr:hypothetical protein [bacterium]
MAPDLPSERRREPAECVVKVAGEAIVDLYPFLTEVTAECYRELKREPKATLSFESRRDEHGRWTVQDAGVLAAWQPIVIEAAFGDYTEEVMRGFIREVQADYPEDPGAATVTVECRDESLALDREHVRTVWGGDAPTDDATIAGTILSDHGLSLHPDSGPGQSGLVLNQDSTDVRFLLGRAEANGYELIFRQGEVYFGPMRPEAAAQSTIMVYAGQASNCYRFSVRADGHQPDRVSFDVAAAQGSETVARVVEPDLPLLGSEAADSSGSGLREFTWRLTRQGNANEEALVARAQAKANELAMKVRAEGELDGSLYGHVLRVGEPVGVDGTGEWLGGTYYVCRVSHRFTMDGYRQSFTLLRNAYGDNLESGSSVLAGVF